MDDWRDIDSTAGIFAPIAAEGVFYDGVSATAYQGRMLYDRGLDLLHVDHPQGRTTAALAHCLLTPPLGSMARAISFPNGERFETHDHAAMQKLDALSKQNRTEVFVDGVERRWRLVIVCLLGLVGSCVAAYIWGIPFAARHIAHALPVPVLEKVSEQVMQLMLYSAGLEESKLPPERLKPLQTAFDDMTNKQGGGYPWRLHFKNAEKIGPNAFALPSGDIDREVIAVLAHEVTHVTQRHGMRMVIQNSGLVILLAGLMGDIASITSLGATLPTVLAQSNYSRKFEIEADAGAAHYCHECGWSTAPLQGILLRMREKIGQVKGTDAFSSHPDMEKRVQLLQAADEKAGIQPTPEDSKEANPEPQADEP
jgi:Zn-dependent protease with chaperone function